MAATSGALRPAMPRAKPLAGSGRKKYRMPGESARVTPIARTIGTAVILGGDRDDDRQVCSVHEGPAMQDHRHLFVFRPAFGLFDLCTRDQGPTRMPQGAAQRLPSLHRATPRGSTLADQDRPRDSQRAVFRQRVRALQHSAVEQIEGDGRDEDPDRRRRSSDG